MKSLTLTVNAETVTHVIEDRTSLADFLREDCDLTATHLGCEHGACGACSVLVDDVLTRSCLKFARQCEGQTVVTLEGLQDDADMEVLKAAFHEKHGLQCGFCTPGMLMSACALLETNPKPDAEAVRAALVGNLCRCTGYTQIIESVLDATGGADGN